MKTGVIGLGAMGAHMARNFHKAGVLHRIWNRSEQKSEQLAAEIDCEISKSPEQLAADCELILICVSRDEDVLAMVNTIASGIEAGTIVVDTSTVAASTAITAAEILTEKKAHFLDCPVSGGVEGAKNGNLAMMVGGDASILEQARSTLDAIAGNIVLMGSNGSGQATKAVNQFMAAGINQAVTEALAFGVSMHLDMDKVIDVVGSGAAGNWFLSHRGKTMLKGEFEPGFKLGLHHKDLKICQSMAMDSNNKQWPILEMTLLHYQRLMAEGHADEDISALYRLKQNS